VPEERVEGVLAPARIRELSDVQAAVCSSLETPVASKPLARVLADKKTALIITVNYTRPSPRNLILPILDACGQQGVSPTIMIATGRHRQMSKEEIVKHLGEDVCADYPVLQHDAFDNTQTIEKGVTRLGTPIRVNRAVFEHDVIIGAGIIEPSYLCGWSGGRKLLMPGLAHHESIDNNHFYLTHPDTRIGRLHGNPVSDDAAEFSSVLPFHFIVYSVVGPRDEVTAIVAGHPVNAHEEGCRLSERIYRVGKKEADVVISSSGGAPYDCNLVQGKKAVIPAIQAVKRNGIVVLCAECPEGLGAEQTFIDWLRTKTPAEVVRDVRDRELFNLGAHGANILAKPIVEKNARVVLVTCPTVVRELRDTYITATTRISEAWELANSHAGRDADVLFIENARRLILC